ncbi:ABC transporter ATP-binding protein [Nocardiopsis tropica]
MNDAVVVRGLSVRYGRTEVLREIDLTVRRGAVTAVVGPSGCGKTTLLRAIAGLERAAAGSIEIDGAVVAAPGIDVAPERRSVGLVPQEGALFAHLTVRGNVGFGLGPRWRRVPGRDDRVAALLATVGLDGLADRRPAELSGGQQQRVALARALAPRPAVIGLDEPFSALDAALRTRLREHVSQTLRVEDATALLVTHDAEEALAMADSVVVLVDGAVRQAGPAQEVYTAPVDTEVARLFGEVTALPGTASGDHAVCALGRIPLRHSATGPVEVLARPGELTLIAGGAHRVRSVGFRGEHCAVPATVGETTVRLDVPVTEAPEVGAAVTITAARPLHAVAPR